MPARRRAPARSTRERLPRRWARPPAATWSEPGADCRPPGALATRSAVGPTGRPRRAHRTIQADPRRLEAAAAPNAVRGADPAGARELLEHARRRTQREPPHEQLIAQDLAPAAPPRPDCDDDLEGELDQIVALARSGTWRQARRRSSTGRPRPRRSMRHSVAASQPRTDRGAQPIPRAARGLPGEGQAARRRRGPRSGDMYTRGAEGAVHRPNRPGAAAQLVRGYQAGAQRAPRGLGGEEVNCTQAGCTGQIVDGYCDVCGMAPPRRRTASSPPARRSAAAARPRRPRCDRRSAPRPGRRSPRRTGDRQPVPTRASRPAGRRTGGDPTDPVPRSRRRGHDRPDGSREPSVLHAATNRSGAVAMARRAAPPGFCRKCGTPFSFEPKLVAGSWSPASTRSTGCLAHGGMGWIYLARDHNVSDRWVVLKGILNAGDSDATAAALD